MPRLLSPITAFLLVSGLVGAAFVVGACTGDAGPAGPAGPPGITGAPGPQGPPGGSFADAGVDGGNYLGASCSVPCHTFNGVVDQWRSSGHQHPVESTVPTGACGNCHSNDSLVQRTAGNASVTPDSGAPANVTKGHISYRNGAGAVAEISYAGTSNTGQVHCKTCHQFSAANDPHIIGGYIPGSAPLRVAGGATDVAIFEKSPAGSPNPVGQALSYRAGNTCIFCHKSRKDITFYITASNTLSDRWGPHESPVVDVYSGKGGYELNQPGEVYGTSVHTTLSNGCVDCHMQPVADNLNTPDHTMAPKITFCKTCHTTYTGSDFNIDGGRAIVRDGLSELEKLLSDAGLITRSGVSPLTDEELASAEFESDQPRSPGAGVDAQTAGAIYNYLIIARSKDVGVHNPRYTKQLLWDSIRFMRNRAGGPGGSPAFLPTRPPS